MIALSRNPKAFYFVWIILSIFFIFHQTELRSQPNPAKDFIELSVNGLSSVPELIEMVAVDGTKMKSWQMDDLQITPSERIKMDLFDIPEESYIKMISFSDSINYRKLVIQR
jgi:hypothetical protein